MAEVGQGPVSLSREVPGFVLNRMQVGNIWIFSTFFNISHLKPSMCFNICRIKPSLQYALLNECWRLVRDGVVSAQDLDVVMKVAFN